MEKLLELIKETEEFKKYVEIVRNNSSIPTVNSYQMNENYELDPALAILETSDIEIDEEKISISAYNVIGKLDSAEYVGNALYNVSVKKDNNDIILNGNINAKFTSCDDSMFDGMGGRTQINEILMDEQFENKLENMADLYPSKTK